MLNLFTFDLRFHRPQLLLWHSIAAFYVLSVALRECVCCFQVHRWAGRVWLRAIIIIIINGMSRIRCKYGITTLPTILVRINLFFQRTNVLKNSLNALSSSSQTITPCMEGSHLASRSPEHYYLCLWRILFWANQMAKSARYTSFVVARSLIKLNIPHSIQRSNERKCFSLYALPTKHTWAQHEHWV